MNEWSLEEEGPVRRPFQQLRDPMVRAGPRAGAMQMGGSHSPARGFRAHPYPSPGRLLHWHRCWCVAHSTIS